MSEQRQQPIRMPVERICPFDPPEEYRKLREHDPVTPLELTFGPPGSAGWLVTGLADAKAVLSDRRFSHRNELIGLPIPPPFPIESYTPSAAAPGAFNKMDPPEHTRYRRLLAGYFTARSIAALTPAITRITEACLTDMARAERPYDLVRGYAEPVPVQVMCELVGVPPAIRDPLARHLAVISRRYYTLDELVESCTVIGETLRELVEEKLANPGEDMLGGLARTGELTADELVNVAWAVIGGGFDTTANMIALGTLALLEHPEQLAKLRERPAELIDNAVEELLRYLTISHLGASRAALSEATLHGQRIRAGDTVVVALAAANRDPAHFRQPDRLEVTAPARGHLAFGHGLHQCLGQHLARHILRIAYLALFARFPSLRLATTVDKLEMRDDMLHYGVHALPVTWHDR